MFSKSNHPLGWCPKGRIYEKSSISVTKFRRSRYAPSLGSGSTTKTPPCGVFSAQDDSGGYFAVIYTFKLIVKPKFDIFRYLDFMPIE